MRHLLLPTALLLSALVAPSALAQPVADRLPAGSAVAPPAAETPAVAAPVPVPAPEATPPSAAAASVNPELEALRQRVDELEAQQAEASTSASDDDQRFKIYGFVDFGLKKSFPSKDPFFAALIERKLTFVLGNINLYFDAQPAPGWRALVEARLTTYPHGYETVNPTTGEFERVDNRVFDTFSTSGRNHVIWGGVILERAQIEHTITDLFNLRVGYFLTPYGIWNVDHGTPTLISLVLPSFQVEESIPGRQLGVQAFGSTTLGDTELGYAAYVTNGRAPYLEDPTDGKAVGGRAFATFNGANRMLKLGVSGYAGDSLEQAKQLTIGASGPSVKTSEKFHYKEWAVGGDLALDWKKLRVRTEGLVRRVDHGNSPHEPIFFGQPRTSHPDRYEYFWYSIFAYRFGPIEPYTYTELKYMSPRDGSFDFTYLPGLGLNIHFSPYAQLKAQYVATKFYQVKDGGDASARNFRLFDSRFVLSF